MKGNWVTNVPNQYVGLSGMTYEEYWRWRLQYVVGPPKASEKHSEDELKEMGFIGLYEELVGDLTMSDFIICRGCGSKVKPKDSRETTRTICFCAKCSALITKEQENHDRST